MAKAEQSRTRNQTGDKTYLIWEATPGIWYAKHAAVDDAGMPIPVSGTMGTGRVKVGEGEPFAAIGRAVANLEDLSLLAQLGVK